MEYLSFKNVNFNYFTKDGEFEALRNLTFSIKKGEFVSRTYSPRRPTARRPRTAGQRRR